MFFVLLRVAHDQVLRVFAKLNNASILRSEALPKRAAGLKWCDCFRINPQIIAGSAPLGVSQGSVLGYRYNLASGARSSMDRIRVSETLDTGSIPVGRTNFGTMPLAFKRRAQFRVLPRLLLARVLKCPMKSRNILIKVFGIAGF